MHKYVVALTVFALSFTVDLPDWAHVAPEINPVQPATAAGAGIFGRPPIGTALAEAYPGGCEESTTQICIGLALGQSIE